MNDAATPRVITIVWLLLLGLTGVSWLFGIKPASAASAPQLAGLALLAVAFFKVRLVIMYFMEVSSAPMPLRIVMEAWVAGALIAVSCVYWFGGFV